jgi:hypothetical protein
MAVCNIFKELKNNTGTFLMFSQYVEDLTRESTQSVYYHVTPSKFIALDVDYKDHNNDSVPRQLQNLFENGCAVCRKDMSDKWTPAASSNLFWNALWDMGIINDNDGYVDEIKYVGDINIQSYNEHDGMGYSEIYCYIPNDAGEYKYQYSINNKTSEDNIYTSQYSIEGYNVNELAGWALIGEFLNYYPQKITTFPWDNNALEYKSINSNLFNINTLILLYDVVTKTESGAEVIYKNIPLGIYFTGILEDGKMTNNITKYVSNDDIFGTGTGYGLRICSRFTVTPNQDNIKTVEITLDNDNYSAISQVMSQMSISQNKMDEILTKVQSNTSAEKELLAMFKNSRTNIPYIKTIDGVNYWFINGRNIGPVLGEIDCECIPYTTEEILSMLNSSKVFTLILSALNDEGRNIFDYSVDGPQNINVMWQILYDNEIVKPEELTLNNQIIDNKLNGIVMKDVYDTTTYFVNAKYDGLEAKDNSTVYFVWPTFFGMLPCDETCGDGSYHNFEPSEDDVKKLDKYIYNSKNNKYTYTNLTNENGETDHVVLAYPKSFGPLNSILDNHGYEYIMDFNVYEKVYNFNGNSVPYYVYVDKVPTEVKVFTLSFK